MPFTTMTKPSVGDATRKQAFADTVIDNLNFLNNLMGGSSIQGVPNGSFEFGTGANTDPAGWTLVVAAGNSSNFETTDALVDHGAQSFSMTNPGSITGGVTLTQSDFQLAAPGLNLSFSWYMKTTVATTTETVLVNWYDYNQSFISSSTLYSASSGNPTSWTALAASATAPAGAKFYKLEIIGVNSTTAGTVYWDGFTVQNGLVGIGMAAYNSGGSFTWTSPITGTVIIEATGGGSGGAADDGGSGGGAAFQRYQRSVIAGASYTVVVGAAGTAGIWTGAQPGNGGDSYFDTNSDKAAGGIAGTNGGAGVAGTGGTAVLSGTKIGCNGTNGQALAAASTGGIAGAGYYDPNNVPSGGNGNAPGGAGGAGGFHANGGSGHAGQVIIYY